jgi:hypothetical protein
VLCVLLFLQGMPLYALQISAVSILLLVAMWEYLALKKEAPTVA